MIGQPLGWPIRCLLLVAAAGLVGLLVLARKLEPDPRGFGTHTQLGLRPCAFLTADGAAVSDLRHDHRRLRGSCAGGSIVRGKPIRRGACSPC